MSANSIVLPLDGYETLQYGDFVTKERNNKNYSKDEEVKIKLAKIVNSEQKT